MSQVISEQEVRTSQDVDQPLDKQLITRGVVHKSNPYGLGAAFCRKWIVNKSLCRLRF